MQKNVSGAFAVIEPRFSVPGRFLFLILSKVLISASILTRHSASYTTRHKLSPHHCNRFTADDA
jgi:hypothetical protein